MKMRRGTLLVVLLCASVLVGGAALYLELFGDESSHAALPRIAAPGEEPAPASFTVVEVAGVVEVGSGGAWRRLAPGDNVSPSESIRTGEDGRAVIRAPSGDELSLRARVELSVDALGDSVTELTLTRGRVRAAPSRAGDRFQISSGGARATAPGGSRFTVFADPRGAVAIASEEGDIQVVAGGEAVTVASGLRTYVPPGGAPSTPAASPDAVFLSVAWPAGEVHERRAVVSGRATPGAEVLVNGAPVAVGDDGRFSREVALRPGKNRLRVSAEEAGGGTTEARRDVVVGAGGGDAARDFGHFSDEKPRKQATKPPPR